VFYSVAVTNKFNKYDDDDDDDDDDNNNNNNNNNATKTKVPSTVLSVQKHIYQKYIFYTHQNKGFVHFSLR